MRIREKKILNAIAYFAYKSESKTIGRLKLMKLLWLSDRLHLMKYGRMVLNDKYYAMPFGPVPSSGNNLSKISQENLYTVKEKWITAINEPILDFFSKSDLKIMEWVWGNFGHVSNLVGFSHQFAEWIRYEEDLNDPQKPNSYPMIVEDFFSLDAAEKFSEIVDIEEIDVSRSIYRKNLATQEIISE